MHRIDNLRPPCPERPKRDQRQLVTFGTCETPLDLLAGRGTCQRRELFAPLSSSSLSRTSLSHTYSRVPHL